MILPFQKNYPLGCNLSCLFLGPWVNFSGTFILFLKQNQPALVFPPQTFLHSAPNVSALTAQTWQVSMRTELLEELKTKHQPPSLNNHWYRQQEEQIHFQHMEKQARDEEGGEAGTVAGGWWLQQPPLPVPHPFLAISQISAFPPSRHASRATAAQRWVSLAGKLLLRLIPSAQPRDNQPAPGAAPVPLWMERSLWIKCH